MGKANILVVEDEPIVAEDIKESLTDLGYAIVGLAASGEDAILSIERVFPDLILMDIMLEGELDGVQTAEIIRERFDIPVIYLTAYSDEEILDRARITAPHGYLVKPFREKDLKIAIEMALYKHRMEKRIKEREKTLTGVLGTLGDAVVATDIDGRIQFMNRAAEALTGWTCAGATGRPVDEVVRIADGKGAAPFRRAMEHLIALRKPVVLADRAKLTAADGTERLIGGSASPIMVEKDALAGVMIVFEDIGEKIRLERELLKVQRLDAIRTLAGGIAHNLNNILSVILGYTEMTLDDVVFVDKASIRDRMEKVLAATYRARDLIQQVMDFSGQSMVDRRLLQFRSIVREAVEAVRSARDLSHGVEIIEKYDPGDEDAFALVEPAQVRQIVMNLLMNAVQAVKDAGGVVEVALEPVRLKDGREYGRADLSPGAYLELTVKDNGSGISSNVMDRIFDPFFTTRGPGEGIGMGLAVVEGVLRRHGGAVVVESEPGEGTTCRVLLPRFETA